MGEVIAATRCRLKVSGERWAWPALQADAVDLHWAEAQRLKPNYFDGPVYVLGPWRLTGCELAADFVATRFRNYIYWRAQGYPEAGVRDGFGAGLILSAEGHVVLGRQRAGNVNAGLAYPPSGFIDPHDVGADGLIDIDASVAREIAEETGLGAGELRREGGYLVVCAGPIVSIACPFRSELGSAEIARRMEDHIAREAKPELAEAVVVTGPGYERDGVPEYARVMLDWWFGQL